jgi:hypothetical protein
MLRFISRDKQTSQTDSVSWTLKGLLIECSISNPCS